MKKQFIYLLVTVLSIMTLCSCEKEMPWEKAQKDVNGTQWLAVGDNVAYDLKFENGKYTLEYTYGNSTLSIRGNYSQTGTKISFEKKMMITYGFFFIEEGTITLNRMEIPLYNDNYFNDREYHSTLKFTLII